MFKIAQQFSDDGATSTAPNKLTMREKNYTFLPNYSSFRVPHVMHFIVNYPSHFAHKLTPSIQHTSKNLRRHDKCGGIRVNRNISRHESNITKLFLQVSKFLIRQGFDRRRVDNPLSLLEALGHGVLRDGGLSYQKWKRNTSLSKCSST